MNMEWDHHDLRCSRKSKRSRRTPETATNANEYSAVESLILLANCGGGFCPAVSTSKKHQEAPSSSAMEESDQTVAGATTVVNVKKEEALLMASAFHNSTYYYSCGVYGKVFQSYQAFGGHKTSTAPPPLHMETSSPMLLPQGSEFMNVDFATRGSPRVRLWAATSGSTNEDRCADPQKNRPYCRRQSRWRCYRHSARPLFDLNMSPPSEYDYDQQIIAGIRF